MTVVVATTTCAAYCNDREKSESWLINADEIRRSWPDVRYFAALETDARGIEPMHRLVRGIDDQFGEWWTFSLDDGRTEVTTANRLRHITFGQNLCLDYACADPDVTHLLFLAADTEIPADTIPKLVELNHPLVGGHVPTYCLDGPRVSGVEWDVRVHMASAAFVMLRRDLFRRIRWRWDLDAGMSDDPCLWHDARTLFGVETLVRHDVIGRHHPEAIGPVEGRLSDARVVRAGDGGGDDPPWRDRFAEDGQVYR